MEIALYFPYISVPQNSWFTRVLLYWDGVASVVPRQLSDRDAEMTRFMMELVNANLVREVSPDHAQWANQASFDEQFLAWLDASGLPESDEPRRWTRMHWEKATDYLFDQIVERGLAHWQDDARHWCVMEEGTAGLYMAYLVGSICRVEGDLVPVTDVDDRLTRLAQPVVTTKSCLDQLVSVTIRDVLPVPSADIPLDELSRFKAENAESLRNLRTHLNGKLADLVLISDETVRTAKVAEARREIDESVKRLVVTMKRRRWPVVLGGAAAIASPALGIGAAIATGGAALALGLGLGSAATGLGSAIAGTQHSPRIDRNSPLAYAALAGQLRPARRQFGTWPFRSISVRLSRGFALSAPL